MSPAPSSSQPAPNTSHRKSSIIKLTVAPSKLSEIQSAPPNPSPIQGSAMSDGEATGGEMSDVGKKKKIKLRLGGTPAGSRAGSPAPGRASSIGAGGSRAGSPAAQPQRMPSVFQLFSPVPFVLHWFEFCLVKGSSHQRGEPDRVSLPFNSCLIYISVTNISAATVSGAGRAQSPRPGTGPIQPHEIAAALPKEGITIGGLMRLFAGRVGDIADQQTEKSEFIKMVKANSAYSADKLLRPKKA
jgi:transcription initiation factor TFIIF subunit alpha